MKRKVASYIKRMRWTKGIDRTKRDTYASHFKEARKINKIAGPKSRQRGIASGSVSKGTLTKAINKIADSYR